MASYTTNYNLKKPDRVDFIAIKDLNDNADTIDTTILAEKEATWAWAKGTFSNPNLIINSNFLFPINQRAQASYQPATGGQYTIDRWYAAIHVTLGLLVQVTSTGINLSLQNGALWGLWGQLIEMPSSYIGETMTVSAKVDGEIVTKTDVLASATSSAGILSFYYDLGRRAMVVRFGIGGDTGITSLNNIEWVKLELGSVATPFVPKPYAEELSLCQRYYEKSYNQADAQGTNTYLGCIEFMSNIGILALTSGYLRHSIQWRVPKRTNPTVTLYAQNGVENAVVVGNANRTGAFSHLSSEGGALEIYIDNTSNVAITTGDYIRFHYVADAEIY